MLAFAMAVFKFLGGDVAKALVESYKAKLQSATQDKTIAADLAGKEIAAQTAEINAQTQLKIAEIGHPWEPEKLAFYVTLFYYAKILIWDKCFGLGTTDPIYGAAAVWAGMIMGFYFTKRGFENVARIIKH